jgi:glycosyltransferase involved in cell wall biosynthesis
MAILPNSFMSAMPKSLRATLYRVLTRRAIAAAQRNVAHGEPDASPGQIVVSGFFKEPSGIGRAADLTREAMSQAGYAPLSVGLRALLAGDASGMPRTSGGAWIIHCNPDEAARVLARTKPSLWLGRRRIGYWAWELERPPAHWGMAAGLFHEIWAPSKFAAGALRGFGVTTPVRVMPHPVALLDQPRAPARSRWGFEDGRLAVLAMGDLLSSATRKNLLGAIEIYRRAFPEPGSTSLTVKAMSANPAFVEQARAHAGGRADIRFVTDALPSADLLSLMASVDVLLSPHRSEGFGLTLAEAMLQGTPALATSWSGNMDFMGGLAELLIAYTPTPVQDQSGVYRAEGQRWAEPDVEDAVTKLRHLAGSPELRSSLAARGAENVRGLSRAWTREQLLRTVLGHVSG